MRTLCNLILMSCISMPLMGFIYQVHILRKWDANQAHFSYFVGLSDFHDKTHPTTEDQRVAIGTFLDRFPKSSSRIIVEDLSSVGCGGRNSCGPFVIDSRGGILGGLAGDYRAQGMLVDNIEYRYCRVCSLSPVLNNIALNTNSFGPTQAISLEQVVNEIKDMTSEIQAYDDGTILNQYYKTGLRDVNRVLKKLRMTTNPSISVTHYLDGTLPKKQQKLDFIKKLLTFDSILLDYKLTHCVVKSPQSMVVAIAGGSHINRVAELLQKTGYEMVKDSSIAYSKEENLHNCLGSHIVNGSFCMKPEPADLSLLESFRFE